MKTGIDWYKIGLRCKHKSSQLYPNLKSKLVFIGTELVLAVNTKVVVGKTGCYNWDQSSGIKKSREKKERHKQLSWFFPQTGSSPVPLALPRRFPLRNNPQITNAQYSLSMRLHKCSSTQARDFQCSSTKARVF
ncbi:hypothetical protein MTR_6g471530 [Medicago truncatula]|uniref:Uncharacterized protein n=1 Tax=Medicago truncatula TaxID=3880 RepID=A0A072ULJ5_MEDTR|nr:hypothetical protein MTR_6g471530 [Medicago truncatula]